MKYPAFLPPNGTISYVAPSFGCSGPFRVTFENALSKLSERGFESILGANCFSDSGTGISASPAECGAELTDAYCSPASQAVISCGGGELMCEILDHVDFDRIRSAPPKWFMGFSDNTNFTFLLTTLCDVASIYGPCAPSFGMEPWHPVVQDSLDVLTGRTTVLHGYERYQPTMFTESGDPLAAYSLTREKQLRLWPSDPVVMEGRLLGGCLDVLVNLLGTCYDKVPAFLEKYKEDGIIFFLEACDLNVWAIRRGLWQMAHAGWFRYVKGFLIGRPLCNGQVDMGLDQYRAVLEPLEQYQVPIILDADLGHLPPSLPLICGSYATVRAEGNDLTVAMELK
jgi:muramoyltetrapeptide carboxypeptidase LdcA involved in peptidoglycan recycling